MEVRAQCVCVWIVCGAIAPKQKINVSHHDTARVKVRLNIGASGSLKDRDTLELRPGSRPVHHALGFGARAEVTWVGSGACGCVAECV